MFRWPVLLMLVICLGCLAGCQRELFADRTPDTPYARYQQLHGETPPPNNAMGGMTPDELRQRLAPLDQ